MNVNHLKREMYKARIAELSGALELALAILIKLEPPDSRAVSDHFVAMAAIHAGGDIVSDAARQIVKDMLEKIKQDEEIKDIVIACGEPEPFSMYDEEGVEGWLWTHPDGRQWSEMGSWDKPAPPHPALANLNYSIRIGDVEIQVTSN